MDKHHRRFLALRCVFKNGRFLGTIFTVGGLDGFGNSLSSGECYSLAFNKWDEIKPMEERRNGHALVTCRGLFISLMCAHTRYLQTG